MIPLDPVTRDGARSAAHRELEKPGYPRDRPPLAVRAVQAVGRELDRLLDGAGHHAPGGGIGIVVLLLLVALAVAAVLRRTGPVQRHGAVHPVLGGDRPRTAAQHRAAAEAAVVGQDWRIAVVERMRAVVRELEERGVLDPAAGRTAAEVATAAGAQRPELRPDLLAAAAAFASVVYGGVDAGPAEHARVAAADAAVRASARGARPRPEQPVGAAAP